MIFFKINYFVCPGLTLLWSQCKSLNEKGPSAVFIDSVVKKSRSYAGWRIGMWWIKAILLSFFCWIFFADFILHVHVHPPLLQIADCFEGSSARSEILHCCGEVERADLHQVSAYLTKLEFRWVKQYTRELTCTRCQPTSPSWSSGGSNSRQESWPPPSVSLPHQAGVQVGQQYNTFFEGEGEGWPAPDSSLYLLYLEPIQALQGQLLKLK